MAPLVKLLWGKLTRRYVEIEAQSLKKRCESIVVPVPKKPESRLRASPKNSWVELSISALPFDSMAKS